MAGYRPHPGDPWVDLPIETELDRVIKRLEIGNAVALKLPVDAERLIVEYVDAVLAQLKRVA